MSAVAVQAQMKTRKALSLFSSAGIGELGLRANGIEIVASNELLEDRHALYQHNYPNTKCFLGDIWDLKDEILRFMLTACGSDDLFLIYATPPCQGMSSNGLGRLKYEVRQGNRSPIDQRNRLIIPTMQIVSRLRPSWLLLENVPGMQRTVIDDDDGNRVNIMDHIEHMMGDEYVGTGEVICCSRYGVPQLRKRLITIYTRDPAGIEYFNRNGKSFFSPADRRPRITLRQAIGHLPPLDARKGFESAPDYHPLHKVPLMTEEKHWWVSNTAEGDTAYNNQCGNPMCGSKDNPLHVDVLVDGRWQSNKSTPVYCVDCGQLLPRPSMVDKATGERRLIRGFHSAYRRMIWDEPARALTKNYIYEASDNKIHPSQNRVLSMLEALIIQTIDRYNYSFTLNGEPVSTKLFAEIIGESVPPALIDMLCRTFVRLSNGGLSEARTVSNVQTMLFT
jgi:DNA (cytosine-5)-methyltransferase 1